MAGPDVDPQAIEARLHRWRARLAALQLKLLELPPSEQERWRPVIRDLAFKREEAEARWGHMRGERLLSTPPEAIAGLEALFREMEILHEKLAPGFGFPGGAAPAGRDKEKAA